MTEDVTTTTDPETNTVELQYGNTYDQSSTPVKLYSGAINLFKFYKTEENPKIPLAGAKFVVVKKINNTNHYLVKKVNADSNEIEDYAWVSKNDLVFTDDAVPTVKSDATDYNGYKVVVLESKGDGKDSVSGLAADTYYLEEVVAPAGFNKLKDLTDAGQITITVKDNVTSITNASFNVENNAGTELPETGGIGTTIFYLIGAILVIGAGVVFVTRRRMHSGK